MKKYIASIIIGLAIPFIAMATYVTVPTCSSGAGCLLISTSTGAWFATASTSLPYLSTTSAASTYLTLAASTSLAYIPSASSTLYVPYTGATGAVNLGSNGLTANGLTITGSGTIVNNDNPFADSTIIANEKWTQSAIEASMAYWPLSNITGGTYSFATAGTVVVLNYTASGGSITSINSMLTSTGVFAAGDLITVNSGNNDAVIVITAVNGSNQPTAFSILYGGTGYVSSTSGASSPSISVPFTFALSGTLTSNATFIMPYGTYLTQSNQWIFANNTTGAYSLKVCVSSGSDACSSGRTVMIPQGTNNNRSVFIQTDGELNVDLVAAANVNDLLGITNYLTTATAASTYLPLSASTSLAYIPFASSTLYVPYSNATGGVNLNNKSLANVSTLSIGSTTAPTGGVAYFNGNVGIGTSNPIDILNIAGTNNSGITLSGTNPTISMNSSNYLRIGNGLWYYYGNAGNTWQLYDSKGGAQRFVVAADTGNVLIPTGTLTVGSTTAQSALGFVYIQATSSSNTAPLLTVATSTGATYLTVLANGNVGIGTTTPTALFTVENDNIATTSIASSTSGISLINTAPAATSSQFQDSPVLSFQSNAWVGTSASEPVNFFLHVVPATTLGNSVFDISDSQNNGATINPFSLTAGGGLTISSGFSATGGTFTGGISSTRTSLGTTTATNGILLTNSTAATAANQVQSSPNVNLDGRGWSLASAANGINEIGLNMQSVTASTTYPMLVISDQEANSNAYSSANALMVVTALGTVGIGSTTPTAILSVVGTTTLMTGTSYTPDLFDVQGTSTSPVIFSIKPNGNVAVGTTTASTVLYVVGTTTTSGLLITKGVSYGGQSVCYMSDGSLGHQTLAQLTAGTCVGN